MLFLPPAYSLSIANVHAKLDGPKDLQDTERMLRDELGKQLILFLGEKYVWRKGEEIIIKRKREGKVNPYSSPLDPSVFVSVYDKNDSPPSHLSGKDMTRKELSTMRKETARMLQEKNDTIASMTQRIQSMEGLYESVLNVTPLTHQKKKKKEEEFVQGNTREEKKSKKDGTAGKGVVSHLFLSII